MNTTELALITNAPVSDDDIRWACDALSLPEHAFTGTDGNDPRQRVLRSNESIDVAACPGSGKTTLLVAKLAILAKRWQRTTQGICVLSHTNVAKREIEHRLGAHTTGRTILTYPHYVGTIHGFINTFVALPYLRSIGTPVTAIDDDLCRHRRWIKLTHHQRSGLERNGRTEKHMRIQDAQFSLGEIRWGKKGTLGRDTPTYQALVGACRSTTEEGYHCHDDMFIWAEQAIEQLPQLVSAVRHRFPYLFLDEVQDNSERQSSLLYRVFSEGDTSVVRQRFGDMNQAIFGHAKETEGARTDPFPNPERLVDVPNSHRFGEQIASVCNPVALVPPGLVGLREHGDRNQTALLLFAPNEAHQLLPAYAQMLIGTFNDAQRREGVFAAVGAVHKAANRTRVPSTFLGHIHLGIAAAALHDNIKPIVDRLAEALIRLAAILNPEFRHTTRSNWHRQARALLAHDPGATQRYCLLALALSTGRLPATSTGWDGWKGGIVEIATAMLAGLPPGSDNGFLNWIEDADTDFTSNTGNLYEFPHGDPVVRIKVGSIHSVKGETHLATLVMDTHYYGSHLVRIKDWLVGRNSGAPRRGGENVLRSLKQHYVAMTRPSHLLCVAMRQGDLTPEELQSIRARHWLIGNVGADGIEWQ
jgi:DNA helicase II / ATP-dependent DNA helicase PcrA